MKEIIKRTLKEMARKPVYWIGFFVLPLFMSLLLLTLMENGLPTRTPVAIVDMDHTQMSRSVTRNLNGMQMVSVDYACEDFSAARDKMQSGDIYGYFLIPQNFERDLLSGRAPVISFYTNMSYYVPASLLYKNFKITAIYTKVGVVSTVLSDAGMSSTEIKGMLSPINVVTRPLHNPELNYAIYLTNSFLPCVMQLMIFLMTCYLIGQEIKYGRSVQLLRDARGSIVKAVFARLLPSTVIWLVMVLAMVSLMYHNFGYPMNGSWGWLILSEVLFVLACQGFALFFYCVIPNLRLALSMCALVGVLSFSLGAFSFPLESMYGSIGIFSYIIPVRYNFLIYIDQVLNGVDIYYSRMWYVAYFIFILLPLTMLWRLKRVMLKPVYIP